MKFNEINFQEIQKLKISVTCSEILVVLLNTLHFFALNDFYVTRPCKPLEVA